MSLADENHIQDLLPEYVLSALSETDTRRVKDHLATCRYCRSELEQYQQIVDDLPLAVTQVDPPQRLRQKMLSSIHAYQLNLKQKPIEESPQSSGYLHKITGFFTDHAPAVGLAIIILLVASNLLLWRQLNLSSQQSNSSMRMIKLENTQSSIGAIGTLIMDPEGKYGTLVVDNLTPLNNNRQYQVWLIKNEVRTSGGIFSVNSDGYASLEVRAPLPLVEYDAISVSIEPAGGSTVPTGANVFNAVLSR